MNNQEILQKFKRYLELQEITSETYYLKMKKILNIIPFEELNQKKIEDFILQCKKKNKPSYVNSLLTSLRAFVRCFKLNIDIPKSSKNIKYVPYSIDLNFLEQEVLPAVDWCDFQNTKKVKAILYLMFYTGMRSNEVYLLKREAFDLFNKRVRVYLKKTKKEKIMLYPQKVKQALEEYFETELEKENAFNIGHTAITAIFNKLKPCFPKIKFHPHMFKKSAVTHLHSCGFSIAEISELIGISIKTLVDHYLNVNMETISKTYDKRIK